MAKKAAAVHAKGGQTVKEKMAMKKATSGKPPKPMKNKKKDMDIERAQKSWPMTGYNGWKLASIDASIEKQTLTEYWYKVRR